ncbi:hypothetical protein GE09DRAFT_1091245 [Coniochaeta sp. 2T2.1]|nr:hypothetical protein GE09DRAFT_1091245 [Coniochaeta sp. 2T2.1]
MAPSLPANMGPPTPLSMPDECTLPCVIALCATLTLLVILAYGAVLLTSWYIARRAARLQDDLEEQLPESTPIAPRRTRWSRDHWHGIEHRIRNPSRWRRFLQSYYGSMAERAPAPAQRVEEEERQCVDDDVPGGLVSPGLVEQHAEAVLGIGVDVQVGWNQGAGAAQVGGDDEADNGGSGDGPLDSDVASGHRGARAARPVPHRHGYVPTADWSSSDDSVYTFGRWS